MSSKNVEKKGMIVAERDFNHVVVKRERQRNKTQKDRPRIGLCKDSGKERRIGKSEGYYNIPMYRA